MSDLVKRLRIQATYDRRAFQSIKDALCWQAADRIAELKRHLITVLPMAKGYAAQNPVGRNQEMIRNAEEAIGEQGNDDASQ